jgi:uncharacterized protein YndB with AHSA1/START domain
VSHPPRVSRTASFSMEVQGDRAILVLRRFLRHPPTVVWRAITEPEQIRQWYLTAAVVEGRPSGKVDLVTGGSWVHATGRILTWDPPRVYEHEWNVTKEESTLRVEEQSVVRWELSPREGGTLLVLTHRGLTRKTADVFQHGLPAFLDRLEAQLDGRRLPDWERGVRESRRLHYEAG